MTGMDIDGLPRGERAERMAHNGVKREPFSQKSGEGSEDSRMLDEQTEIRRERLFDLNVHCLGEATP
jgi:hypothetical protein